jgi:hypothetical protein
MLIRADPHGLHQPGVDPREVTPLDDGAGWNLEKVQNLSHTETIIPASHLQHDDGPLIGGAPLLLKKKVPVEHSEETAPDIDQPLNRLRHTRNSGGGKAGEDLTHDPCRGRANNLTDSKDDGVERGGVSHLY